MPNFQPGDYRIGGLNVHIDEHGRITGDWTGTIDEQGRVRDPSGNIVGTVYNFGPNQGAGYGIPTFQATTGETHTIYEMRPPEKRPPPVGAPDPGEPYWGSLSPGTYQVGDLTINVDAAGRITGDWTGFIDSIGRVYDANGVQVGSVVAGSFRPLNNPKQIVPINRLSAPYQSSSGGSGGGGSQPGQPGQPGQNVLTGISNEELQETIDFLKGLLTETSQQFLNARDEVNALADLIAQESPRLHQISRDLETFTRGAVEHFADILHRGPTSAKGLVSSYIENIPEMRQAFLGAAETVTKQIIPALSRSLQLLDTPITDYGSLADLRNLRENLFPEYRERISKFIKALSGQAGLAAMVSEDLVRGIKDIMAGKPTPFTREYEQRIRELIETLTRQLDIATALSGDLSTRVSDVLAGRITLPEFIKQALEQHELARREELMRELGPSYATSTPGQIALRELERFRQSILDQYRTEELQRALTSLVSQQQAIQSLSGLIGQQELTIPQLRIEALSRELAGLESQHRAVQGLIGTAGQQALTVPQLGLQISSLASELEQARERAIIGRAQATGAIAEALLRAAAGHAGMIQEASAPYVRALGLQETLRNMFGATMSDVLSGARDVMATASQAAAYQALPIALRTGLASEAISALGRAAFLPMQARATALGLLNAAMGGSNVDLGGLMAAIPQTISPSISASIAQLVAQLGAQRSQGLAAGLGAASGGLLGLTSNLALMSALGGGTNWAGLLSILGSSKGGTVQMTPSMASALQNAIPVDIRW